MTLPVGNAPARSGAFPQRRARVTHAAGALPAARRAERMAAVALWGLVAAWAVITLGYPLGFDHGIFAWVADVVRAGGMPYRDAWDMHGPLVPYLVALPMALVGGSFWGVRALDLLFVALGAAAFARLLRAALPGTDRWRAAWLTALFVLAYAAHDFNNTAQPDVWVAFGALAVLAWGVSRGRTGMGYVLGAGLAAGTFALVKPFFGLLVLPPLLWHATGCGAPWRRGAVATVVAGLASAVPIALMAAWFWHRGALDALVDVHLRYPAVAYNDGFPLEPGKRLTELYLYLTRAKLAPVAMPLAAFGAWVLWVGDRRRLAAALGLLLALGLFFAVFQHKYYDYHWMGALPPMFTLAAIAIASALEPSGDRRLQALGLIGAGALALSACVRPAYWAARGLAFHTGLRPSAEAYYKPFEDDDRSTPWQRMQLGDWMRARLQPGETFAIWGTEAGVMHFSGARTPFRLAAATFPIWDSADGPLHGAYVREFTDALRRHRPAYLVVNRRMDESGDDAKPVWLAMQMRRLPVVQQTVDELYETDTLLGPFRVMRLR